MKTEFNKSLGDKIVLFFKSQIAAYTDKNGRFVPTHYDKRTKKGKVKHATESRTADMFADAPSPEPKKVDKKADWTELDIFGEPSKSEVKNSGDDWPESFLKKKEIRPHEALSAAMKRGDLKAALDVIAPLSLHEAKNTVMWAGFPMRAYKSKKDMMTEMQTLFMRAAKEGKDGYGLRDKAAVPAQDATRELNLSAEAIIGKMSKAMLALIAAKNEGGARQIADASALMREAFGAEESTPMLKMSASELRDLYDLVGGGEVAPKRQIKVTPQVLSERVAASIISSAAESIARLRSADVGRVMDETPAHYKLSMAQYIKEHRRDLSDEVDSVMAEDSPAPVKAKKLPYASKEDLTHLFGKSETSFDLFLKSHVKQFTRKDGSIVKEHDDKRQKKVQAAPVARQPAQEDLRNTQAPAKDEQASYGHHNMNEGDSISFKAGDFAGKGKIKSVGQDGATVTDQSGRDHQVHWHEVTGRGGEPEAKEEKPDTPKREAQKGDADGKVIGKIDDNTARRANADETSRALFNTSETDQLPKKALQSEKFDSWDKISAGATEALDQFKGMLGEVAKSLDLETGKIPATYDFAQAEEDAKNKADGKPAVKLNEEKYMTPKHWDNDRGFLFIGPLKKKDRAEAKVKADYTNKKTGEQDWTQLKDMVRATIAVPSVTQIPKVLAEMKKAGIVLAQQPKNNLTGEGLHGSGYRDINLIVKMPNGMLAELQIHCKPMTHAKEHGHEHYAANAAIERQYDSEDEDHTTWAEEHQKTHAENASKMKAIYDKAWDKAIGGGDDEKPTETLHKSLNKPIMILLKRRAK